MAENKTKPTKESATAFLNKIHPAWGSTRLEKDASILSR
jgi:hypothetical protein